MFAPKPSVTLQKRASATVYHTFVWHLGWEDPVSFRTQGRTCPPAPFSTHKLTSTLSAKGRVTTKMNIIPYPFFTAPWITFLPCPRASSRQRHLAAAPCQSSRCSIPTPVLPPDSSDLEPRSSMPGQTEAKRRKGFFLPAKHTLHIWCRALWTPEPAQSRRGGRKLHAQEQRELFRLPTPPPEADSLLQEDLGKSDVCLTERLLQGQHCLQAAGMTAALTCSKTALDSKDYIFLLSCNTKSVNPTSLCSTVCNLNK